jgi:multisubunit Na+/H+ antiporter MnhF subunit
MNVWYAATLPLLAALLPCAWVCLRRGFAAGLVAVQLAGMLTALALLILSEAEGRQSFASLALVLATVSSAGTLVLVRFLERQR